MVDVARYRRQVHDIARVDQHVVQTASRRLWHGGGRRVDRRPRLDGPSRDRRAVAQMERVDETGVAGSDDDARAVAVECRYLR